MREAGKRGKMAAELPMMGTLKDYASASFPTPPRTFDYSHTVSNYPMALNDKLGDCTIAGVVHLLQLAYAEVGETFNYPGDDAVEETYFTLSGGEDSGLVEHSVLQHWLKNGLFETNIVGYAPVNIRDPKEMADALYAFGALYLGVEMPTEAEQQFETHQNWHIDANSGPPAGGHCVVATGASPWGLEIITWGSVTSLSWEWWQRYASEAWVVIPEIYVEAGHGPVWSVNLPQLQKDLRSL
jgi:hypothetical protein